MCVYALALFSCKHELWGRRTKLCTIGEDFRDGHIEADCTLRGRHPLKTMHVSEPCYNCFKIKALPMLCRAKLEEARSVFKERWPEEFPTKERSLVSSAEKVADGKGLAPKDDESKEEVSMDEKEQVIEAPADVNVVVKPQSLIHKGIRLTRLPKKEPAAPIELKTGLPGPKTTLQVGKTALPAPKPTAPTTTPPRASRLSLPVRRTPEKTGAPSKATIKTPPKVGSKLPKPGFLRK